MSFTGPAPPALFPYYASSLLSPMFPHPEHLSPHSPHTFIHVFSTWWSTSSLKLHQHWGLNVLYGTYEVYDNQRWWCSINRSLGLGYKSANIGSMESPVYIWTRFKEFSSNSGSRQQIFWRWDSTPVHWKIILQVVFINLFSCLGSVQLLWLLRQNKCKG